MANHPKRGRGHLGHVPTAEEVKAMRGDISQSEAAEMIYVSQVRWSDYETGKNRMHPSAWELFKIKRSALDGTKQTI